MVLPLVPLFQWCSNTFAQGVYNFHSLHVYIIILSQPLLLCRLLLLYFSPNYPTQPINYPTQPIYYPTQSRNTVVGTGQTGAYIIFPPSTLFWPAQIWPRYWRVTLRRCAHWYTIFRPTHCVAIVVHKWFLRIRDTFGGSSNG